MVHVVDLAHLWVCDACGLIDAESVGIFLICAHTFKTWCEFCEVGNGGACTWVFIYCKSECSVIVINRNERPFKTTFANCDCCTTLTLHCKCVALFACEPFNCGDEVCRDSLRDHVVLITKVSVVRSEAIHMHWRWTRHGFHATSNNDLLHAREHAHGGEVHGLLSRPTETVQSDARSLESPSCVEC